MRHAAFHGHVDDADKGEAPRGSHGRAWDVARPDVGLALDLIDVAGPPAPVIRDRRLPLYIYGRGELGRLAVEFFDCVGESVAYWFERDEDTDRGISDVQIAVAVSSCPYASIEADLLARGYKSVVPFYDLAQSLGADHPLQNGWTAVLTDEDRVQIRRVFGHLEDERSRANYLSFLAWRTVREELNFAGVPTATINDRYFVPEVVAALGDDEVFLDGGAYDGRVSRELVSRCAGTSVVVVEPDRVNLDKMDRSWTYIRPVMISTCALSDSDHESTNFYGGFGFMSRLGPGRSTVTVRKIDSLDISPTFVKLHLEGGELAALRGARETLGRCRLIVAVTTYHTDDGVWRILNWMIDNLDDYRFLWRNHGWCGTGAVAYAVPMEMCR